MSTRRSVNTATRWAYTMALTDNQLSAPCATCGTVAHLQLPSNHPDRLEIGHIIPDAMGGAYALGNLIPQCSACNRAAGNTDLTRYVDPQWLTPRPTMRPSVAKEHKRMVETNAMADAMATRPTLWQER